MNDFSADDAIEPKDKINVSQDADYVNGVDAPLVRITCIDHLTNNTPSFFLNATDAARLRDWLNGWLAETNSEDVPF